MPVSNKDEALSEMSDESKTILQAKTDQRWNLSQCLWYGICLEVLALVISKTVLIILFFQYLIGPLIHAIILNPGTQNNSRLV